MHTNLFVGQPLSPPGPVRWRHMRPDEAIPDLGHEVDFVGFGVLIHILVIIPLMLSFNHQ